MSSNRKNQLKPDGDKEIKIFAESCSKALQLQSAKKALEAAKQRDNELEKVYTIPIFKGFMLVSKEKKEKWIKQQKRKGVSK